MINYLLWIDILASLYLQAFKETDNFKDSSSLLHNEGPTKLLKPNF